MPFGNVLKAQIESYIIAKGSLGEEFLFVTKRGKPLYEKMVYRMVNSYLNKVTTIDKKSPHVLRHTFATHMLNNGADLNAIKELLGHVNLSATQVYTHNTVEKLKNIHKQAHPSFCLKGRVSVLQDDGSVKEFSVGDKAFTKVGTQRVFFVHEDTRWCCVYKTDKHTVREDEKDIYAMESYKELPQNIIDKNKLTWQE